MAQELIVSPEDERRLRMLANDIAKDIEEPEDILGRLGFSREEYEDLSSSRIFRAMLDQARGEWEGASNTQKRARLKAAAVVEDSLEHMHAAITNGNEKLADRVKAFEAVSRISGLAVPEPVTSMGSGQQFVLSIHLDGKREPLIINGGVIEGGVIPAYSQSRLLEGLTAEVL